jgi:hypothetical protein
VLVVSPLLRELIRAYTPAPHVDSPERRRMFAVLLDELRPGDDPLVIGERILRSLDRPIAVCGRDVVVTGSEDERALCARVAAAGAADELGAPLEGAHDAVRVARGVAALPRPDELAEQVLNQTPCDLGKVRVPES